MSKVNDIIERWNLREETGENQKEIAIALNVTESYVSHVLAPFKREEGFNPNLLYMPKSIKIAWKQVADSIESAWGKVRDDGTRKWDSKYAHFLIVKNWIESLL